MALNKAEFKTVTAQLAWEIEDYDLLSKFSDPGQCKRSFQFPSSTCNSLNWELEVYPAGIDETSASDEATFLLRRCGQFDGERKAKAEVRLFTLHEDPDRYKYQLRRILYSGEVEFSNQQTFHTNVSSFDVLSACGGYLLKTSGSLQGEKKARNNTLMLFCELKCTSLILDLVPEIDEKFGFFEKNNEGLTQILAEHFREIWQKGTLSDCVVRVGEEEFKAHRCVLAHHSEVFSKMFEKGGSLDEAKNGVILVRDLSSECVRALLEFFYTGAVDLELLKRNAEDILAAAHKYMVTLLFQQCERYLAATIDEENIVARCIVADIYDAVMLRKVCINYVRANRKSVMSSPEWEEMQKSRVRLAYDLLKMSLEHGDV